MTVNEGAQGNIILALSNLLSANIDVGLKYCLDLGYHDDSYLRIAFMQLMNTVLRQGARFGRLAAKRASSAPRPFINLISGPNYAFAVAICEACPPAELDEMASMLFRALEARGSLIGLIKVLIEREVSQTSTSFRTVSGGSSPGADHESELFRANSPTTRLLTIFAKTYG